MNPEKHNRELFLFEEMKAGKEYAFDFFFNYYYPGLCVFAQQIGSVSLEDSKNLVQDVFLKFWHNRKKLTINTSVRSYLFVSVKNRCFDFIKQANRKGTLNYTELDKIDLADESMQTFVLTELEAIFQTSLNKLPERCREVFELSRFEGLKNKEIAKQLNISEKTVENQMTKALRILKKEMKDFLPLLIMLNHFRFFE